MMRPLGLYLAEFRPDAPAGVPVAAVPALPAEPEHLFDFAGPDTLADTGLLVPDAGPWPGAGDLDDAPADDERPDPEAALAAALAAQRAEHESDLLVARAEWAATEGAVLAARMAEGLAALEQRIADALASLMEPFLAQAARVKALAGLRDMLDTLLTGGEARPFAVSGPADLLAALRESHGGRAGLSFTEADTPDVTVSLGDTRIRSQLRAWARTLESALEAAPGART